ncbi:hypothetical protein OAG68_01000 [bacterium]|nr:hypothetical protein [bacterium]
MYSGVRAAFNRTRSFFLPKTSVAVLHKQAYPVEHLGIVKIRVHARPPSSALPSEKTAGMISIFLDSPGVPKPIYALLQLTSHFGCGHLEIAFYEEGDEIIIYAVRNIIRSNIARLRWKHLFRKLRLHHDDEEIAVLQTTLEAIGALGLKTSLASPEDCIRIAIGGALLKPENRVAATKAIYKRYSRISKKLQLEKMHLNQSRADTPP